MRIVFGSEFQTASAPGLPWGWNLYPHTHTQGDPHTHTHGVFHTHTHGVPHTHGRPAVHSIEKRVSQVKVVKEPMTCQMPSHARTMNWSEASRVIVRTSGSAVIIWARSLTDLFCL